MWRRNRAIHTAFREFGKPETGLYREKRHQTTETAKLVTGNAPGYTAGNDEDTRRLYSENQ